MASVIRRRGYTIEGDYVRYDDVRSTYKVAEKIAGRKLDRRRNYAIIDGKVCSSVSWSQACSGCHDSFCGDRGTGCRECGYQGRVRSSMWYPIW